MTVNSCLRFRRKRARAGAGLTGGQRDLRTLRIGFDDIVLARTARDRRTSRQGGGAKQRAAKASFVVH